MSAKGQRATIIIMGAHYDTRPAADKDPDPARQSEDRGSQRRGQVAVLLELARVLEADKLQNEVWLTFFDAEDRVIWMAGLIRWAPGTWPGT